MIMIRSAGIRAGFLATGERAEVAWASLPMVFDSHEHEDAEVAQERQES